MKKALFGLLMALGAAFVCGGPANSQETNGDKFLVLTIDGRVINPIVADYVLQGIDDAELRGYQGLIVQMDTPGGLLESTRIVVKKILNARVPVIVYVAPSGSRAGSAGVFIALASHVAAMAPSTNIGAAHPVMMGQEEKEDRSLKKALEDLTETLRSQTAKKPFAPKSPPAKPSEEAKPETASPMEDKILNDTVAWIETIAGNRNRNAAWARRAVFESVSATEKEALDQKVIDLIATDLNDLLTKLDGRVIALPEKTVALKTKNARLVFKNLTRRQTILDTLINPNIAYGLLMLGVLGLFIEVTHPGVIFPGVLGVICLIVALYAFAMLPINFAGFLLMALGIIFFIAEALTPMTFGLLTLAGGVAMLIGSLMLIDSPFAFTRISLNVILPFVLAIATIVIFLVTNVLRAHRKKVASGPDRLIGQTATAQTEIDVGGEGQVFLEGEIWTALNQGDKPVAKGDKVRVLKVDKVKLIVTQ